jgi:sugar lactone lactonase YvrE
MKVQYEEDKINASNSFKENAQDFVKNFYSYIGPLLGLLHGVSSKSLSNKMLEPIKESIQRLENETQLFIANMDVKFKYNNLYTFAVLMDKDEYSLFEKISSENKIKMKILVAKTIKKDINVIKPQAVIVSKDYLKFAYKIKNKWPFMPVIVFGDMEQKMQKKLISRGIKTIMPPFVTGEVLNLLNETANKSIAWPEYWDKIMVKTSYFARFAVTCSVIAILGVSGYFLNNYLAKTRSETVSHYITPYPQPTNIAFDGKYLWVCDWFGQSIYKHDTNKGFSLVKIFHFPEKHFTTLACAGGYLWTADPWNKKIYKHNLDESLTIIGSYQTPNAAPSGLASDGKVLWSCDSALAMIYRHKLDDKLTIEESFKSPGTSPSGLYFDGEKLWSIDSKTNKIYCHNINNGLAVEGVYLPVGYEQKGFNLSGIAFGKDRIWICSERMGEILSYQKTLLAKVK